MCGGSRFDSFYLSLLLTILLKYPLQVVSEKRTTLRGPTFENVDDLFKGIGDFSKIVEAAETAETGVMTSVTTTELMADTAGDVIGSAIRKFVLADSSATFIQTNYLSVFPRVL